MKRLITSLCLATLCVTLHAQADLWIENTEPVNEYYHIPLMLTPSLHFAGKVMNIGDSAANNVTVSAEVYNSASTMVYSAVSSTTTILNPGDSLTFTIPSYFLPATIDEYRVVFTTSMTAQDPNPSDNVFIPDSIHVTDSVWSRENENPFVPIATSGNTGGFLGQQFVLTQPAALTSISGFLQGNVSRNVAFVVFPYNNGRPGNLPIATTDTFMLGPNDLWITLPILNGPLDLPADTFVIAAQEFGTAGIDLWLSSGNYTPGSTWVKWQSIAWTNIETYGQTYALPFMLRANITQPTAVTETSESGMSLLASPNPTTGLVTLSYNFETNTDAVIEVYNPLGQSIMTSNLCNVQSGHTILDLQNQARGLYTVVVFAGDQRKTMELIVE